MNWPILYNKYLEMYEKGLKKQAKLVLKDFIDDFKKQSKPERREFSDEVNKKAFETEEYSKFLPQNLYNEIVLPEIRQWITDEPDNSIPRRWSEDFETIKKGVELNPRDQIALEILAQRIISKISMNQHEIRCGYSYDGNPTEDIFLIVFFESYLNNIQKKERKSEIMKSLADLKHCAMEAR